MRPSRGQSRPDTLILATCCSTSTASLLIRQCRQTRRSTRRPGVGQTPSNCLPFDLWMVMTWMPSGSSIPSTMRSCANALSSTRQKTRAFSELQSHYLFADKFGRPAKGNDKGKVEGLVGYIRRNFLVPIPRVASWEELNQRLLEACRERRARKLRGHQETIGERFERDRAALLPLPNGEYEACEKQVARVSSMSLVRYRTNDYSVPTEYGHRDVLVKGYVHEVVIVCGSRVVARHRRSYQREDMVFDPLHYLALLEQKARALDQAAP